MKRSPEFRSLRPQLAGKPPHPVYDSWMEENFHFFVFALSPTESAGRRMDGGLAVFTMHPESPDPVAAVTVVPTDNPNEAVITNLRAPGGSYTAPIRDAHAESPDAADVAL